MVRKNTPETPAENFACGQGILLYSDASAQAADSDIISCENYTLDYTDHIPISLKNDPLKVDFFRVVMTPEGKALEITGAGGERVTNLMHLPENSRLSRFGFGAEYLIAPGEKAPKGEGAAPSVTLEFNGKPVMEFTARGEILWQGRAVAAYRQGVFFRIWLEVKEGRAGLYLDEKPTAVDLPFMQEGISHIGESVRGGRLLTKGAVCRHRTELPQSLFPEGAFIRNASLKSRIRQGMKTPSPAFQRPEAAHIISRIRERDPRDRHQRLYMTDFRRDRILDRVARGDGREWFERFLAEAEQDLEEPFPEFCIRDKIRLLPVSRLIKRRLLSFSSAYRLTGEDKFLRACLGLLRHAAAFPHWNDTHFLDTAELCCGFAIAYDAIYPALSQEDKEHLAEAMIEKALIPALMEYRYGNCRTGNRWSDSTGNWNPVCNAGILMGAICIARENEALAAEILDGSLAGIAYNLAEFLPDGAWGEGLGYWHYTIEFIAYYFDALYTSAGSVFGYLDGEGISRTMLYYLAMSGPGGAFNYGDMEPMYVKAPEVYWYASVTENAGLAETYRRMERQYGYEESLWSMLHFDPAWDRAGLPDLPLDLVFRRWWVGSMRSSWHRENSVFLAFQGGRPNAGHSQMSMGNFVLDMDGVRWALDLGYDDYNLGYLDLSKGTDAWWIYRKSTEGHNCFLIDPDHGLPQVYNADSPICRFETSPEKGIAVLDLSPAYARTAVYAYRSFCLDRGAGTVTITDSFRSRQNRGEFVWFLHTAADIELQGDRALLRSQGRAVLVEVTEAPSEAVFGLMGTKLLDSSPKIAVRNREAANEGIQKLVLRLCTEGDSRISVRIKAAPEQASVPCRQDQMLTPERNSSGLSINMPAKTGGKVCKYDRKYDRKYAASSE